MQLRRAENLIYCSPMFCPNCAAQNDESQHYCRMCGLNLDGIVADMVAQNPPPEMAAMLKRKRQVQVLGVISLSIAGVIGLMLLLSQVIFYKLLILGPELLFGSAIGALVFFLIASVVFFNYPKFFMRVDRIRPEAKVATPTSKLLNDPPFEPASVTEHSTELLRQKKTSN